jgi:hypothetical protein
MAKTTTSMPEVMERMGVPVVAKGTISPLRRRWEMRRMVKGSLFGLTFPRKGMVTFRDGMVTFRDGMVTFRDGMVTFRDGMVTFRDGVVTFRGGVVTFRDGVVTFGDRMVTFRDGMVTFGDRDRPKVRGLTESTTGFSTLPVESVMPTVSMPVFEGEGTLEGTTSPVVPEACTGWLLSRKRFHLDRGWLSIHK